MVSIVLESANVKAGSGFTKESGVDAPIHPFPRARITRRNLGTLKIIKQKLRLTSIAFLLRCIVGTARRNHFQLQLGMKLLPLCVSSCCSVPSESMVQICVRPPTWRSNTMCRISGDHDG